MKKIYYEKVGRRYIPVSEYDSEYLDSFSKGTHLVMCYPGGQSRRYNIDPNYAALIAAGRVAEDAMCTAIRKASEMRPQQTPLTEGQRRAWKKLAREFGNELATLNISSARDVAEAGLKALQDEADELMTHPAVKDAYDQFLTVCKMVTNKA
jgi:hypothetical protein